jgi:S-DNA-T family DNA segregation ATPase FtsK/SpoIIIE
MAKRNNRSNKGKTNELLGIICFALAIIIFLSLISYNENDRTWLTSSSSPANQKPSNLIGIAGAQISGTLIELFGITSFLVAIFFIALGWNRFRAEKFLSFIPKFIGCIIFILSIAALLSLTAGDIPYRKSTIASGGSIGLAVKNFFVLQLNETGAILITIIIAIASLVIATRISFTTLAVQIERILVNALRNFKNFLLRKAEVHRKEKRKREVILKHLKQFDSDEKRIKTTIKVGRKEAMKEENREKLEPALKIETPVVKSKGFTLPPTSLLNPAAKGISINQKELVEKARNIEKKYQEFSIEGKVVQIHPGPVVTTFEFKPGSGIKYSRLVSLTDDLCLALKAESIRISRIPGKSTVGIEVPNEEREIIQLREIIEDEQFQNSPSKLTICLGKLIDGSNYVADLAKMPHLLIAGATGSGKSVALNNMICSMLYKASPNDIKFIMIDTKRLELGIYEDIPHLLTPVVIDAKLASNALKWAITEMENRLKILASFGVRNIEQYNNLIQSSALARQHTEELQFLPYLVIIIDELADLMILSSAAIEESMTRLAQMARAVGIHMIVATQRPSVDIITGIIKANFPSRISFRVSSKVDSRTIIDTNGAEKLLGKGDMLFLPPGTSRLIRIHASYMTEAEALKLINFWKRQGRPRFDESVTQSFFEEKAELINEDEDLYHKALQIVITRGSASISNLQRKLRIGYNRAARLVDIMQAEGVVGPTDGIKPRKVLVGPEYLERFKHPG